MKRRAFIAINRSKTAKQALATFISRLKIVNADPALRYVKPDRQPASLSLPLRPRSEASQRGELADKNKSFDS